MNSMFFNTVYSIRRNLFLIMSGFPNDNKKSLNGIKFYPNLVQNRQLTYKVF